MSREEIQLRLTDFLCSPTLKQRGSEPLREGEGVKLVMFGIRKCSKEVWQVQ